MTAAEFFEAIGKVSGLLFVVSSMLAMGLSLTVPMILQPLKNVRLVILALLANFVLVPLLAYLITLIIPLEQSLKVGLVVLATAAGAPFLPKLVQGAKGNVAFGVGLMVLLMVVTIIYMPLVLPLLLTGVSVNPWDIAKSLIVLMLVPLALGLLIKSHSPDTAAAVAAGDGQDLQPGHPRPARGGAGAERLQYPCPDRHGRSPGAAALHHRVAADRPPAGRPRCRATAA